MASADASKSQSTARLVFKLNLDNNSYLPYATQLTYQATIAQIHNPLSQLIDPYGKLSSYDGPARNARFQQLRT
jgi:hypothetical protein